MKHYYANIPGVCGPISCKGYNEREARKDLRDRLGYGKRLPGNTKLFLKVEDHSNVKHF